MLQARGGRRIRCDSCRAFFAIDLRLVWPVAGTMWPVAGTMHFPCDSSNDDARILAVNPAAVSAHQPIAIVIGRRDVRKVLEWSWK